MRAGGSWGELEPGRTEKKTGQSWGELGRTGESRRELEELGRAGFLATLTSGCLFVCPIPIFL